LLLTAFLRVGFGIKKFKEAFGVTTFLFLTTSLSSWNFWFTHL